MAGSKRTAEHAEIATTSPQPKRSTSNNHSLQSQIARYLPTPLSSRRSQELSIALDKVDNVQQYDQAAEDEICSILGLRTVADILETDSREAVSLTDHGEDQVCCGMVSYRQ
jgi:hypothetical protein